MANVTLTQTRGTISELPCSCSKGTSPTPKICLNKFFKEEPDMAETIPGYQSINIMKQFPFKPLTCVCFPSPPHQSKYFPQALSKRQLKLEQIGLQAGQIPAVMTQTPRTWMFPMRTTSQLQNVDWTGQLFQMSWASQPHLSGHEKVPFQTATNPDGWNFRLKHYLQQYIWQTPFQKLE